MYYVSNSTCMPTVAETTVVQQKADDPFLREEQPSLLGNSQKCVAELETICQEKGRGLQSTLYTNKSVDTGEQIFATHYFKLKIPLSDYRQLCLITNFIGSLSGQKYRGTFFSFFFQSTQDCCKPYKISLRFLCQIWLQEDTCRSRYTFVLVQLESMHCL